MSDVTFEKEKETLNGLEKIIIETNDRNTIDKIEGLSRQINSLINNFEATNNLNLDLYPQGNLDVGKQVRDHLLASMIKSSKTRNDIALKEFFYKVQDSESKRR